MGTDGRTFSLTTVLVTALASFLFSGVGGALLQRYISRAKPEITVTSAGFEGPPDYIEIQDELIGISDEDSWGPPLAKYEKFDQLRAREEDSAGTEARLTKLIAQAETWLHDSETGSDQLTRAELLKHPLIAADSMFGNSLNGMIRRQELKPPPISDIAKDPPIYPLFKRDNELVLHTGRVGIRFPTAGFMDKQMYEANDMLAASFSKGIRKNISFYTRQFLESERRSVLTLKRFRDKLRGVLLEQSRPTLTIVVHNAGDVPAAFRPYFGMSVLGSDGKTVIDSYLMVPAVDKPSPVSKRSGDSSEGDADSKEVKVDPYLPRVGGLSYTTISPGGSETLRLVATTSLGAKGTQYRASYESGLLSTKVIGLTTSGSDVWSTVSVFGANVNKASGDDILQRMK
jgi:hypothetical protein